MELRVLYGSPSTVTIVIFIGLRWAEYELGWSK
jgi:hypothetical protein